MKSRKGANLHPINYLLKNTWSKRRSNYFRLVKNSVATRTSPRNLTSTVLAGSPFCESSIQKAPFWKPRKLKMAPKSNFQ